MEKLVFPLSEKEAKDSKIKMSSIDNRNTLFPTRLRELRTTYCELVDKTVCLKATLEKGIESRAISQQLLADRVDVTKSTISLYENGDNVPDAKTIVKLAKYFTISTDYLLCQVKDKTPDPEIQAICEKTGLSEGAYNAIMRINSETYPFPSDNPIKCLDYVFDALLQNESFYELLHQIRFIISQFDIFVTAYDSENGIHITRYDDTTEAALYRLQKSIDRIVLEIAQKVNIERKDLINMIDLKHSEYLELNEIEKG